MNQDAQTLLLQLEVRKALLLSLKPSGLLVLLDERTGLCHGEVCDGPALVPVEHAKTFPVTALQMATQRNIPFTLVTGTSFEPMVTVVADELLRLDVESAWVRECGGGVN